MASDERQETVDDVLREWRDMVCYSKGPVHPLNHGAVMQNLDRIEAALKRERADHTCECGDIATLAVMHGADVANKNHAKARAALVKLTRPTTSDLYAFLDLAKFAIDHCMYGGGVLQALVDAVLEGKRVLKEEGGAS